MNKLPWTHLNQQRIYPTKYYLCSRSLSSITFPCHGIQLSPKSIWKHMRLALFRWETCCIPSLLWARSMYSIFSSTAAALWRCAARSKQCLAEPEPRYFSKPIMRITTDWRLLVANIGITCGTACYRCSTVEGFLPVGKAGELRVITTKEPNLEVNILCYYSKPCQLHLYWNIHVDIILVPLVARLP